MLRSIVEMDDLKSWIREKFSPKLLVMSTSAAKDFCGKFRCTPAQFLQAFCSRTQGFSIRPLTNEIHHPYFRLTPVDTLSVPLNKGVLAATAPQVNWQDTQVHGSQDVDTYLSSDPTPWFTAWESNFLEAQSFKPHELIDMPVAIVYLACTHETTPIEEIRNMSHPESLPEQYKGLFYNYKVPRVYLLLHDLSSEVTSQQATMMIETLKQTYKQSICKIQSLNTGDPEPQLSTTDKSQMSMIFNEIVTRILSPFIQTILREMDAFLDKNKRGFKNTVRSFFKKGGDKADSFTFQLESVEHTTRYIADLSFLFGDYDVALNHYRTSANEFKSAKAWRHAAAAFEMQAMCAVLLSGDPREIDYALDSAYGMYEKSGDQALMIRCALIIYRIYKGLDANKRLVQRLISIGNSVKEFPEVNALFLEQTALCYLRLRPAHFRKFAFYKILAGDEYRKLKMITHALHCYYITYPLYKGKRWHHIQLHLEHNLARFSYFLDLPLEGVHFFLSLAASPQLLSTNDQHQKKVLNELMSTVSKWTSSLLPEDRNPITNEVVEFAQDRRPIVTFPLPQFLALQLHLAADDECERVSIGARVNCSWGELIREVPHSAEAEEECKLHDCAEGVEYVRAAAKIKRQSYVGEMLQVHVTVRNPLKLALIIESLQALVTIDDGAVNEGVETFALERVELQQDSQSDLALAVKPLVPGKLVVTGVQWLFGGLLHCRHTFTPKNVRIASRGTDRTYALNQSNRVTILPPQALVKTSVQFQSSQSGRQVALLQGQLENCTFTLTNDSSLPATDILLVFKGTKLFGAKQIECGKLNSGENTTVKVVCRGDQLGLSIVRALVVYHSEGVFRYCRVQVMTEVREAVRTNVRLDSSLKAIHESTLAVSVEPLYPGRLCLTQVSCASVCTVSLTSVISDSLLYFRISDLGASPDQLVLQSDDLLSTGEIVNCREPPYVFFLQQGATGAQKEFVVFWELSSPGRTVKGMQSFVATPKEALPVHITIRAPTNVSHDFTVSSRVLVPVVVSLKNLSKSQRKLQLEAISPSESTSLPLFYWQGHTRRAITIADQETADWPLTAVMTTPGAYELNRVRIMDADTKEELPLTFQHLLVVG